MVVPVLRGCKSSFDEIELVALQFIHFKLVALQVESASSEDVDRACKAAQRAFEGQSLSSAFLKTLSYSFTSR